MKSKSETLQNQIIKETFAKNRMSKAPSVQKKIGHGRTDRQTDTHIFLLIICRQIDRQIDMQIDVDRQIDRQID